MKIRFKGFLAEGNVFELKEDSRVTEVRVIIMGHGMVEGSNGCRAGE